MSEQAYTEFYRHLGHLFDKPWATLHWRAEGTLEFSALLFVPGSQPVRAARATTATSKVRLHVRRMFITDGAELLPPWLRFVQGVVDTEDLPLNVSREMLQSTPVLARIRKRRHQPRADGAENARPRSRTTTPSSGRISAPC